MELKVGDLIACSAGESTAFGLLLEIKGLLPYHNTYGMIKWFYNPAGFCDELYLTYLRKLS